MTRQSTRRTDADKVKPILAAVLGDEMAAAIIEFRDDVKKEPMTEMAAKIQVKEYIKTGNPIAAAEMQILRSWIAIKADWYANEISRERHAAPTRAKPMSDFMRAQADIKDQLERRIYGESDEFAGTTIDVAAGNFRAH